VAKAAAGLVIVDDDFSTIVAGIREGRIAYDNVRKVVLLLMSTGAAEMLLVVLAVATGLPLPLTAAQLLWLNLVTSGVQDVALAFGAGEGDELTRPPRPPAEAVFDRLMVERVVIAAAVMGLASFVVFWLWLDSSTGAAGGVARARNATLLVMVLFENMHLVNCRSERRSALARAVRPGCTSPVLVVGTLAALALHVLAMHWGPAQAILGVAPLAGRDWLLLLAVAGTVVPAVECHKWWCRRRAAVRESGASAPPADRPPRGRPGG
jgi:magnesium-transporting ATPase (P-type)